MKRITQSHIRAALYAHSLWLRSDGDAGRRLMLRRCIINRADLSGADMHHAVIESCILRLVDLSGAELHCARIVGCVLIECRLDGADLWMADLSGSDLRSCSMQGTVVDQIRSAGTLWGESLKDAVTLRQEILEDLPF